MEKKFQLKKTKTNPLISIIIPVHKTPQKFLQRCIESLEQQTYKRLEIIIVNDGGSDLECCRYFAEKDERIAVISQKNKGVSAARNTGLKVAKGSWCIFVDSDDWVDCTMCEDALKAVENFTAAQQGEPDLIFWPYKKEYAHSSQKIAFFKTDFTALTDNECAALHAKVLDLVSGLGSVWAKMYRCNFIRDTGVLFNTNLSLGEDIEFNFRLFKYLKSAVYIHSFNYHYRYDEITVSNAFNPVFADKVEMFAKSLYDEVGNLEDCRQSFFYSLVSARVIHSVLAISLRYCFHNDNPCTQKEKLKSFGEIRRRPVFYKAIKESSYSFFSLARKAALFCLKHRLDSCIRFIAYVRQKQYAAKLNCGNQ